MNDRSQRQSQTSVIRDVAQNKSVSDSVAREDRDNDFPFFYANYCLGFFPVDPVDYQAFAKGQLMAMAVFVPAAIALFIFCAS
jgi:hypothetical protein